MKRFTLIELLIVVAIIGILLSILLPSLSRAREKAYFAVCTSQRSQLYKSMQLGLKNNDYYTPMIRGMNYTNPAKPKWEDDDWMGASKPNGGELINGVIEQYSPEYRKISRCPSLPTGTPGDQIGSNGHYDYTHPYSFARIKFMRLSTVMYVNSQELPTLWVTEESPKTINGIWREGAFANKDTIGSWHDRGTKGGYTAIDGSSVIMRNHFDNFPANNMTMEYKGTIQSIKQVHTLEAWPRTY